VKRWLYGPRDLNGLVYWAETTARCGACDGEGVLFYERKGRDPVTVACVACHGSGRVTLGPCARVLS
jgi:DnaJ-class molecular chaperone